MDKVQKICKMAAENDSQILFIDEIFIGNEKKSRKLTAAQIRDNKRVILIVKAEQEFP